MGSLVSLDSLNFCTEFLRDRSRKPKIKSFLHQPMRSNWWLSQILWMVFVVLRGLRWLERMSWKSDKKKKVTVCVRGENVLAATTSTPPLRHVGLMLYWSCVDDVQMMRIGKRIWKGWKDLRLVFVKVLHCSSASFVSNKTFNVSPLGLSLCYYASMRQPWGYRFNCAVHFSVLVVAIASTAAFWYQCNNLCSSLSIDDGRICIFTARLHLPKHMHIFMAICIYHQWPWPIRRSRGCKPFPFSKIQSITRILKKWSLQM